MSGCGTDRVLGRRRPTDPLVSLGEVNVDTTALKLKNNFLHTHILRQELEALEVSGLAGKH